MILTFLATWINHRFGVVTDSFGAPVFEGLAALAILSWLRARLFPRLLFDIGKSSESVKRASGWRTFVFGSVGVALIVGIAGSLIANFISQP
jgi:hypothetical protein